MYQGKVDQCGFAVKSVLADVSSVSPSSLAVRFTATPTPTPTKTSSHRDHWIWTMFDSKDKALKYSVFCDMNNKVGVGVTVISHDSESRTQVNGCDPPGCYSRNVTYTGASLAQLASLTSVHPLWAVHQVRVFV